MRLTMRAFVVMAMALIGSTAYATIPAVEGKIERIYPSNRVIVVDGEQFRIPKSEDQDLSFDELREGVMVSVTAGAEGQDGTRPVWSLDFVEEAK